MLTSAGTTNPAIVLDVVALADRRDRFLRVRKPGAGDKAGLAALVPASLLLPQASSQGSRLPGYARIAMADGTPLGESGVTPDPASQEPRFLDTMRSPQYPLVVTASMPRTGVVARYDDLRRLGTAVTGGIALVILLFAMLLSRRPPPTPRWKWRRPSRMTSSCRITSRWSICRTASCSAPKCWCAGAATTAMSSSRTPSS